MKQAVKITFCAVLAALSAVLMLFSYLTTLTYAVPAMAGLLCMIPVIEIDRKWALGTYCTAAVLVFLMAEQESKWLYIAFFGFYPIVKSWIEQIGKPLIEWLLKLVVFNACMLLIYGAFSVLFSISLEDFAVLGKYGAWIFLAMGNAVFVLYDVAVTRMAMLYIRRLSPQISKLLHR